MVPQEPVLYSGTLAENIAYGKPRATRQEILAAARRANCDFVGDFPDGLETEVGPRGAQLSGGQKQVTHLLAAAYETENSDCSRINTKPRYSDFG